MDSAKTVSGIVLENDRLRVELDPDTGAFRRIEHKTAGLSLLGEAASGPPWRL